MTTTINLIRRATASKHPNSAAKSHADFARQATVAEFGRHARALDWGDFVDRQPDQTPRRLDDQFAQEVA